MYDISILLFRYKVCYSIMWNFIQEKGGVIHTESHRKILIETCVIFVQQQNQEREMRKAL